ncbi:hypothetical protein Halru_2623 [Halovivax ruber XH-70]|uniref:Uncharacterized protein n=1 Tax=Halovivax ruber (strain DSM 18193 / JCM 13892 / XH-70) TaxID=797302 RepID=L0IG46_HALRX|nr:hypothetical protein [Halovivax ruber]AGB17201.1 hypothetical protein Halru_2623 [Halovivax ruber XH-70]
MRLGHVTVLEDFGTRSLLIHGIMVVVFANAILVGLLVEGFVGVGTFVALLSFTAGLWIAHSINSLGNAVSEDGYEGILNELVPSDGSGVDFGLGRFGRLLALIASVTAIALLTSAQVLSGPLVAIVVVAIGAVAVVTAIVGFLIALGHSYDASQDRTMAAIERNQSASDTDEETVSDR